MAISTGLTHLKLKASLRGAAEAILNNRDRFTTLRFVRYDSTQLRKSYSN